jgi:hypothetical protein
MAIPVIDEYLLEPRKVIDRRIMPNGSIQVEFDCEFAHKYQWKTPPPALNKMMPCTRCCKEYAKRVEERYLSNEKITWEAGDLIKLISTMPIYQDEI